MMEAKIDIQGLTPSKDLCAYIDGFINWLSAHCPFQSYISLQLKAQGKTFTGLLEVHSQSLQITTRVEKESIEDLIMQLNNAAEHEIKRWHALRFMPLSKCC